MQFRIGAVLQHSTTPSLRVAGFEDEDDDEYENEAPCEGGALFSIVPGVKTWLKPQAESFSPSGQQTSPGTCQHNRDPIKPAFEDEDERPRLR